MEKIAAVPVFGKPHILLPMVQLCHDLYTNMALIQSYFFIILRCIVKVTRQVGVSKYFHVSKSCFKINWLVIIFGSLKKWSRPKVGHICNYFKTLLKYVKLWRIQVDLKWDVLWINNKTALKLGKIKIRWLKAVKDITLKILGTRLCLLRKIPPVNWNCLATSGLMWFWKLITINEKANVFPQSTGTASVIYQQNSETSDWKDTS